MEIKNQYEKDGYIITEFENGFIEEVLKNNGSFEDIKEKITEEELFKANIETNIDYITCMLESLI